MSVDKFQFVSPGVQFNEIDESVIVPQAPAIGPVVIGTAAKGPLMQPVMVSSVAELERVFGAASNGIVGATDVFRKRVPTAPTLGTYAAKAFLRNSSPVTVIRLGGVGGDGWSTDAAYQVYTLNGTTATLAATIYASSSVDVQVSNSVGGWATDASGSATGNAFVLRISSSTAQEALNLSFDSASASFIRDALNTNPTLYSSKGYFLGETYEKSQPASFTGVYVKKQASTYKTFSSASNAQSPLVIGNHASGSSVATAPELFKFTGLDSGANLAREVKVSIENVRASKNAKVTQYGTFDVVVRKLQETSNTNSVLERYNGVNLDPTSDQYIAKVIGDTQRVWDSTNLRYQEIGSYPNRSAYIRVEVQSGFQATALPHGFRGPSKLNLSSVSISGYTASCPAVALNSGTGLTATSAKNTRYGLLSDLNSNSDLVDLLNAKPDAAAVVNSDDFSARFIGTDYAYSKTTYNTDDVLASGKVLGFDLPLIGGSDGTDIKEVEPLMNNRLIGVGSTNNTTAAAYKSVKQAIEMTADPEVMDMSILCVPGLKNATLTKRMVEICRGRGDAMALVDLAGDYLYSYETNNTDGKGTLPTSTSAVITTVKETLSLDDSYGAAYFPAVFVSSEGIYLPASIAALGAYGGTEGRSALWFAPAGFNRGGLTEGSAGIGVSRTALYLTSADRDALYDANINPIATFPGEGVVIFGQKTLQITPSALDRVNVRRLTNYIKKQVSRAATRVLFEPNIKQTWNNFTNVVNPFLLAIKGAYGLEDAKVVLDETTTTADLVDRNIMYCKIYIKPTRAIEYIAIDFIVTSSGAAFAE
jgi:hypothetical protein